MHVIGSVQHHQASKEHLPLLPDQNHSTIAGDVSLMPPQTDDQITATLRKVCSDILDRLQNIMF